MVWYPEFIPAAGACLVSRNVLSGRGRVRWLVRQSSVAMADNGWRVFSSVDSDEYLADPGNMKIADYNEVCAIEPLLIGVWDFPVGSDLQVVDDELGKRLVDTVTGQDIPEEAFYVPPSMRDQSE